MPSRAAACGTAVRPLLLPARGHMARARFATVPAPIVTFREDVAGIAAALPRPLVFANGVFDLLHAGHVLYLQRARRFGAALAVGVNDDASVRRLGKGDGRPLQTAADRCRVIAALAGVDVVLCFAEATPLALIRLLRPQVCVKGSDHALACADEAEALHEWGGRIEIVPRVPGLSTTALIERIVATFTPAPALPRSDRTTCGR